MSCISEAVYSVYVDGELEDAQVREVESHLVQCRECRALVMALRDECSTLRDALRESAPASVHRVAAAPPARGLAIGVLPSLALLALAATVAGWLIETRLPASVRWLNPVNLIGAYEMAFDLLFWIRNQAPELLELLIAVAATASVSAMLTFAVTALFRRFAGPAVMGLLVLGLVAAPRSEAVDIRWHEDWVTIAAGEVLDETLIVSAKTVRIDGILNGDLVVMAERVVIEGEVRGNVFAGARSLNLGGVVMGSVHAGSERIRVTGRVEGDLYAAGEQIELEKEGSIARDFLTFADGVLIDGSVGRDVFSGSDWVEIRGSVGRNLHAISRRVELFDGAAVGGDAHVELPKGRTAEISDGASIGGELRESVHKHELGDRDPHWLRAKYYGYLGIVLTSMFLVGLGLHALAPGVFASRLETPGSFARALGLGLAALLGAPIALALVAITLVGIPIAIIGFWTYLTTLFVATIVIAALVGSAVMRSESDSTSRFGLQLLVGLLLVGLFASLPYVGGLFQGLMLLAGLGLLVERAFAAYRASRPPTVA